MTVTQHGLLGDVPAHVSAEAGPTTIVTKVIGLTPEGILIADQHDEPSARPAIGSTATWRPPPSAPH